MTAPKPLTAIIVSETHWDRAWYLPFQTFRLRLVRLIDRLLEILAENPDYRSFMLDGQTLPIEDYLEIRPEKRAQLTEFAQDGRLFIGPWYALADEFLVSPEALIRNLMIGLRMADEMGGAARVGYVPDAFGHIRQLPQILRGFGIDSALFYRGMGDEAEELGDEFTWQAPEGSEVLTIHLRTGYFNAANLGYPIWGGDTSAIHFDLDLALDTLRTAVERLQPYNKSGIFLLLNGIDHADPDPRLPEILAQANQQSPDIHFKHGNLPDYLNRVRAALGPDLPTFQGEFNRSRYGFGLQGVYSSRMYLQQANEQAQTLLECYTEPIQTWAWLLGESYPAEFMDLAWRTLLKNHPHDDICGCSVDAVHRENRVLFDQVRQIGEPLARDGFRTIMTEIDRTAQSGTPFVVYNPVATSRSETVSLDLVFNVDDSIAADFHLVNAMGQSIPMQILARETIHQPEVARMQPEIKVQIAASLEDLPGCGYRVYYAQPGQAPQPPKLENPVKKLTAGMENQFLQVYIQTDGTLNIYDKRTGQHFENCLVFVDDEDAGDEYDYSPAPNPEQITTAGQPAEILVLESGTLQVSYQIRQILNLPVSLTANRQGRSSESVSCALTTRITLRHNSPRLDITTSFDNQARDHRLRVLFPTDIQTDVAAADGHFDVIERPIAIPDRPDWDQPPVPTRHQRYFVDLSDGETGLAVFNRGLAEYEILTTDGQNTIALTLLRAVGYLSCGDLATRPAGNAGPANIATPEAQCLGTHTFEYALAPHPGNWEAIYADSYRFRAPVYIRNGLESEGFILPVAQRIDWKPDAVKDIDRSGSLPAECSFLTLESEIITVSAIKKAERGSDLIVRLYNPTAEARPARVQFHWPLAGAYETNLNEVILSELPLQDAHTVGFQIEAKSFKSLALRLKNQQE